MVQRPGSRYEVQACMGWCVMDPKLMDCFKPIPLPEKRPGQTYQPRDESWYEIGFLYRVDIKADTSRVSHDSILFETAPQDFFTLKKNMQDDVPRWGRYRKDWFCVIEPGCYSYYFMTRNKALEFRLWAEF